MEKSGETKTLNNASGWRQTLKISKIFAERPSRKREKREIVERKSNKKGRHWIEYPIKKGDTGDGNG